jgi:hypothetical protein
LTSEPSEHVSFAHRRTLDRDFYFIANTSEQPQRLDATFRVGRRQPEKWGLRTGVIATESVYEHTPQGTRVPLWLDALESRVMAFARAEAPSGLRTNMPPHGCVREN